MSEGKPKSPRNLFDHVFFAPLDGARPWLIEKFVYLMVAFDCWLDLLPHGGRYGIGGFNVAHFRVLDVLLPRPSAQLYVAVIGAAGLIAFISAFTKPHRGLRALVALLYTYGWTMSMLDSYQHHYLLSWVLGYFVLFPKTTAKELFPEPRDDLFPRSTRIGAALTFGALAWALLLICGQDALLFLSPEEAEELRAAAASQGLAPDSAATVGPTMRWLRANRAALSHLAIGGGFLVGLLLVLLPDDPRDTRHRAGDDEADGRAARRSRLERMLSGRESSTPAYVLLSITAGVVYFFTAITKLNADWRDGAALRRIARSDSYMELQRVALEEGFPLIGRFADVESYWKSLAHSAILVQFVSFTAFVLATHLDRHRPRLAALVSLLGLAPLSFHIGAEHLNLSIGWFSYYMLLLITLIFAPRRLLVPFAAAVAIPSRRTAHFIELQLLRPGVRYFLVAFSVLALAAFGRLVDLPGSLAAGVITGVVLLAYTARSLRGKVDEQETRARALGHMALAALLAGATMLGVITPSEVRWDYYRFVGGEHRRRGEWAEALAAYQKANQYAPLGQNRQRQADEMRQRLETEAATDGGE